MQTILFIAVGVLLSALTVISVLLMRSKRRLLRSREALAQNQERLDLTLHASGIGFWSWEIEINRVTADDNCSTLFGVPKGRFPRNVEQFVALLHPDDRERVQQEVIATIEHGAEYNTEFCVVWPQGSSRYLASRAKVYNRPGQSRLLIGASWDVTERHSAQEALQAANTRLSASLEELQQRKEQSELLSEFADLLQACPNLGEAYAIVAKFCAHLLPDLAGALFIFSPSRNLVNSVITWNDALVEDSFEPSDCWALRRGQPHSTVPKQFSMPCGHLQNLQLAHACFPLMAQGNGLGIIYLQSRQPCEPADSAPPFHSSGKLQLAHHIAEQVAMSVANLHLREALRLQTIRDSLTGLYNRRYLEDSFERELHRIARRGQSASFAMMDLDNFKTFNDTFGHEGGDALLRAFGQLLRDSLRKEDLACRYGGEEFCVLFCESSLDDTVRLAERLRSQVKTLIVQHGGQHLSPVTVSIGIASYPNHGTTVTDLIAAADDALYEAKARGRDCLVVATGRSETPPETANNLQTTEKH